MRCGINSTADMWAGLETLTPERLKLKGGLAEEQ